MDSFSQKIKELVLNGEEFRDAQAYGYMTEGGTCIVGSSYQANDDDVDHDLMAITPWGDIYPLRINAHTFATEQMLKGITEEEIEESEFYIGPVVSKIGSTSFTIPAGAMVQMGDKAVPPISEEGGYLAWYDEPD